MGVTAAGAPLAHKYMYVRVKAQNKAWGRHVLAIPATKILKAVPKKERYLAAADQKPIRSNQDRHVHTA